MIDRFKCILLVGCSLRPFSLREKVNTRLLTQGYGKDEVSRSMSLLQRVETFRLTLTLSRAKRSGPQQLYLAFKKNASAHVSITIIVLSRRLHRSFFPPFFFVSQRRARVTRSK